MEITAVVESISPKRSRTYTPTGGQPQEIQWLDIVLISCSEQKTKDGESFMANRIKIHQIRKINDYREPPAF